MKSTAKDWDQVRGAFASSIMVDTALDSLAQNLDGPSWPLLGEDETPAKYIDLGFDELMEAFQGRGQPPELVDALVEILRETLAFDTPFGEMIDQSQAVSTRENPLLRNMARLGISENFPLALTALEEGTREFCHLEKLETLGEFAVFAQNMSQAVIVGGDFRKLLNALSHVDEVGIAEILPFRRGQKGLHLIEAVGMASDRADAAMRVEKAVQWFREDLAAIEQDLAAGGELARHFRVLADERRESRAIELLRPYLRVAGVAPAAPVRKKRGLFSWFSRK